MQFWEVVGRIHTYMILPKTHGGNQPSENLKLLENFEV